METKKRRKAIKYSIIAIVILIAAYHLGWIIYHKPAFHGRVIDAETQKPIEEAVVVAVYNAFPIIHLPGGGSDIEIGVQEVLTDEKGEFHVPSYTTIIFPLWARAGVNFVIYKPEYGNYPDYHISPPRLGATREEFFLEELGTEGEFEWLSKKIKVTFGVVELPKLRTWEERRNAMIAANLRGDFPDRKIQNLVRLINQERKNLGLTPYRDHK